MSPELDLRGLHQPHEPDAVFVATLEQRLEGILADEISSIADASPVEDGLLIELHLRAPATHPAPRRWIVRALLGAAAALLLLVALAAIRHRDERTPVEPAPTPPTVELRANGWVAVRFGGLFLLREGDELLQEGESFFVDPAGAELAADVCPAFSPDGERLLIGGNTIDGGGASLSILSVAADGGEVTRGLDGNLHPAVSLLSTIPLEGIGGAPCAIWAPDGRWAALGGEGEVLVVDTETGEVRRLPGYSPTDLEWRPGTDELAIADDGIHLYSVSTGEIRPLRGVEAEELTWSPDGSTIAFTQAVPAAGTKSGITLIDADGTNPRPLTTDDYVADHGIGVVWSPRGDQIAYQRERTDCTGDACYERSEVVLVTATNDGSTPIGTERPIPPLVDNYVITGEFNHPPPFRTSDWQANSVTWSPDGTELLYYAGEGTSGCCLIVVPVDGDHPARVLDGDSLIGLNDERANPPWIPLQQWQGLPLEPAG